MAYFRCVGQGSGGGSVNILKGTTEPTASQGSDGQIYLKYSNEVVSDLEYISNTSSDAYIPTGETGNKHIKFVMDCNIHGGGSYITPIGARERGNYNGFLLFFNFNGSYANSKYAINNGENAFGDTTSFLDERITLTLSNEVVRIEDTQGNYIEQIPANTSDFSTPEIALFNLMEPSGIYGSATACYMDLYECKIYSDNELIKWLLPATQNNVIGLIDVLSGTFYAGVGTLAGTARSTPLSFKPISKSFAKVSGNWQDLIGSNINDINTSGGGGMSALTSDFSGLCYGYIAADGFFHNTTQTTKLDCYSVQANKLYAVVLPENPHKNRARIGFFADKTYSDFSQYIDNPSSESQQIYESTNLSLEDDISNIQYMFYTPTTSGELIIGSNNQSYSDTESLVYALQ